MKKVIKIIMIVIILFGVSFSIFNFLSIELNAGGDRGAWIYTGGSYHCMGDGNDCDIEGGIEED